MNAEARPTLCLSGCLARPPRSKARRRAAGFSLLETVVAMAVLSVAGMALFGLFNSSLIALTRADDVSAQVPVVRRAVAILSTIDPDKQQQGNFVMGDHEVAWTATLVEPKREGQGALGGRGPYRLGLYELEFRISHGNRPLGTWRTRQVGHRDLRAEAPAR